jgi:hypothetical protein
MLSLRPLGAHKPRGPRLRPPLDAANPWRSAAGPCDRRVVRYGACEFRAMEGAHGLRNPVGYPAAAVAGLRERHGVAATWQNFYRVEFESLPTDPEALARDCPSGRSPDVVIVQVGAVYAKQHVLLDQPPVAELRSRLSRRVPEAVARAHYVALDPVLAAAGRPYRAYPGAGSLDAFFGAVRQQWPGARTFAELPFAAGNEGLFRGEMLERVRNDIRRKAYSWRIEVVDHTQRLGADRALRSLNGYNVNERGSAVLGAFWAERLAEEWAAPSGGRPDLRREPVISS